LIHFYKRCFKTKFCRIRGKMFTKKSQKKAAPSEGDQLETSVEKKQSLISVYIIYFLGCAFRR